MEKAKNILGWTPKVLFAKDLKKYIEFVRKDINRNCRCSQSIYFFLEATRTKLQSIK